ncbi:MAG: calcium-binding protein [Bacteroidales bacterium]
MNNTSIITEVLKGVTSKKYEAKTDKWFEFLSSKITLPFEAKIKESENHELQIGEIIKVTKITDIVDMYGLLVEIKKGRKKFILPICDIEIVEKNSENYKLFDAFLEWWEENR